MTWQWDWDGTREDQVKMERTCSTQRRRGVRARDKERQSWGFVLDIWVNGGGVDSDGDLGAEAD